MMITTDGSFFYSKFKTNLMSTGNKMIMEESSGRYVRVYSELFGVHVLLRVD